MDTRRFDFHLPEERIAQAPLPERDASRLMVVNRATRHVAHRRFRDLHEYLGDGDLLIRNNATVLPARLLVRRLTAGGGAVECFLHRPTTDRLEWWCLLRPGRKLAGGSPFGIPGEFSASVVSVGEDGSYRVRFQLERDAGVTELARRIGSVPLPPYIQRAENDPRLAEDRARYQTVFAADDKPVAAAAPTAGLHFTPALLERLSRQGVRTADVTLHVGLGTFRPMHTDRIEDHVIHREHYEIPVATLAELSAPHHTRRVAVGTTVVRTLEHYARHPCIPAPGASTVAEADLFLHPPARFHLVQSLITNFHMPRSTLLCLVASFLSPEQEDGVDWLQALYREALEHDYRFLSYGDAMLIL